MNQIKAQIQAKNDALRRELFTAKGGLCTVSRGVHYLPDDAKARILLAVKNYNIFNEDNDPHKEHDFGVVELPDIPKVFWKIDYFEDAKMDFNPESNFGGEESDFINAYRVLTIMLADEY